MRSAKGKWQGRLAFGLLGLFAVTRAAGAAEAQEPVTAILGALGKEIHPLTDELQGSEVRTIQGIQFAIGRLRGRRVVVGLSGVGTINAAIVATLVIEHFRPAHLLFTGIAGGLNPDLKPGDIVIAEKTVHHDLGALTARGFHRRGVRSLLTGERYPVFFPADPVLLKAALAVAGRIKLQPFHAVEGERPPRVVAGVVATGDMFVALPAKREELRKELKADAVEMEGAAVAQVCWLWRVPCLVIRSVSDLADDQARQDAQVFAEAAAENGAALLMAILEQLDAPKD